jgi:hypothetical protein
VCGACVGPSRTSTLVAELLCSVEDRFFFDTLMVINIIYNFIMLLCLQGPVTATLLDPEAGTYRPALAILAAEEDVPSYEATDWENGFVY